MTAPLAAGLALAVASAAALNCGFFVQHGAAAALPPLSLRRPLRSLVLLARSARWVAGFATGLAGWALYVAALAFAPLSLVQAAAAGGIGLLALLAARGAGLARRERLGVLIALVGLLLLALSLGGRVPGGEAASASVAVWMAASAVVAALAAGPGRSAFAPGAGFGVAAGVLYAAGDVGTKAALGGGGRVAFVPALLTCHGLGFAALQLGFQRGGALATAGLATIWMNALPIVAGMTLFGETPPEGARGAARALAFACVVVGAALLARPDAAPTGALEPTR